ncbi:MAG: hypothetical protein ACE5J9_11055 [Methanosarcinales archaeon]
MLAPLLFTIKNKGIDFEKVYVDGGYTSYQNIARVHVYWNARVVCKIAKNWRMQDNITIAHIYKEYNKVP